MRIFTAANILTAGRLVLFAAFIVAVLQERAAAAALFFAMAWGFDAVDGWLARRFSQETAFGYTFDKVVDRIVIAGGLLGLVWRGWLPQYSFWLLAKDVALIPAMVQQWGSGRRAAGMGWWGKFVSVGQGVSILWLLAEWPGGAFLVGVVAAAGILTAGHYYFWPSAVGTSDKPTLLGRS
ncbi:MAG: hypothetical protein COT71_00735 [Candidatus Andersenbacteria bacterium CG10_big_fil_rev_8_21_14_0_10_54_11]|uniref:CDP-alcohol phosphatidyltransferase family protein n=1 Tax=Candidatus Andersenbacteria bacterium CG10_big_fil_rev_8_21_14_0_10_54_11 TaxID=1974485 RepID=A0A2M6X019_9BACT|nr:MAG: hypothetical protein COT71_00735 [Candidatus Andersenbacteria bacterium CG10_big_fil_rev_8_21_14_0_10_54_11]